MSSTRRGEHLVSQTIPILWENCFCWLLEEDENMITAEGGNKDRHSCDDHACFERSKLTVRYAYGGSWSLGNRGLKN